MAQLHRHALQMNDPQKVSLINAKIINDAYALHAYIYARLFGWTSLDPGQDPPTWGATSSSEKQQSCRQLASRLDPQKRSLARGRPHLLSRLWTPSGRRRMRMKQGPLPLRMMPFWRTSWQRSSTASSMPRYTSRIGGAPCTALQSVRELTISHASCTGQSDVAKARSHIFRALKAYKNPF